MAFKLNRTATEINRVQRNLINANWETLEKNYGAVFEKSNNSAGNSEQALRVSQQALEAAREANQNTEEFAENLQNQLNEIVADGDSSAEVVQARVDENGNISPTLKARIDNGFHETKQLIDGVNVIYGENGQRTPYRLSVVNGHLSFNTGTFEVPGPQNLFAGDLQRGYYGLVQPSEFGMLEDTVTPFNGQSLVNYLGIVSQTAGNNLPALPLFPNTGWLKFAFKGKTLFIPQKPIYYQVTWEDIYKRGAVYGDDTIGLLPPNGQTSQLNVMISANAGSNSFTGVGFVSPYQPFGPNPTYRLADAGDTIVVKGFNNPANNGEFRVASITDTQITVVGRTLVNETGTYNTTIHNKDDEVIQSARIVLNGLTYRVRLIKANQFNLLPRNEYSMNGPDNEHTNLLLATHLNAPNNFSIQQNVGTIQSFGTNFTSSDLGFIDFKNGTSSIGIPGSHYWTQGTLISDYFAGREILTRGGSTGTINDDGSEGHIHLTFENSNNMGYRPVLELME